MASAVHWTWHGWTWIDHNWSMHVLLKFKDFPGSYTPANEHSNAKSTIFMILFTKIFHGYVSLSEDMVQVFFPLWTQHVSNSQISEAEFDFRGWFFLRTKNQNQDCWWSKILMDICHGSFGLYYDWCFREMLQITWEGNETVYIMGQPTKLKWCNRRRCGKTTNLL